MIRGAGGAAGGGIYLANSARETEWKTEHHGIVLKCKVKMGKIMNVDGKHKKNIDMTFAELVGKGYDSVLLDRGECPSGAHKGQKSGDEVVVYSWDQVIVVGEVPRDKCSCAECQKKKDKL